MATPPKGEISEPSNILAGLNLTEVICLPLSCTCTKAFSSKPFICCKEASRAGGNCSGKYLYLFKVYDQFLKL